MCMIRRLAASEMNTKDAMAKVERFLQQQEGKGDLPTVLHPWLSKYEPLRKARPPVASYEEELLKLANGLIEENNKPEGPNAAIISRQPLPANLLSKLLKTPLGRFF